MSIVVIQIGQCGNQVGRKFFDDTLKDGLLGSELFQAEVINCFFNPFSKIKYANSLLVDMEQKVINNCLLQSQ